MRGAAFGAALVLVAGCDATSGSTLAKSSVPAVEDPTPEPETTEEPRSGASTDETQARERRRAALRALQRGRLESRRGHATEAIAAFRESVEARPSPTALCELGWALFRGDRVDEAREPLERAAEWFLHRPSPSEAERRVEAACLYNLGRVHQAQGRDDEAAAAYRRSLRLRSNAAVRQHLEALGAAASDEPERSCPPEPCLGPISGGVDAVAARALARARALNPLDPADPDRGRARVVTEPRVVSDGLRAGLIEVGVPTRDYFEAEYHHLAVERAGSWYACPVGGGWHDDPSSNFEPSEPRARQIVAGGEPELLVEIRYSYFGSMDCMGNEMSYYVTFFVGFEGATPLSYGGVETGRHELLPTPTSCDPECMAQIEVCAPIDCCHIEIEEETTRYEVVDAPSGIVRLHLVGGETTRDHDLRNLGCPPSAE